MNDTTNLASELQEDSVIRNFRLTAAAGELALMDDLLPLLSKRAQGRDISGLNAYEQ